MRKRPIFLLFLFVLFLIAGCVKREAVPEVTEIITKKVPENMTQIVPENMTKPTPNTTFLDFRRERKIKTISPSCPNILNFTSIHVNDTIRWDLKCFPDYYFKSEGLFLEANDKALPILGRACGRFNILVVFFDSTNNLGLLLENENIPSAIKEEFNEDKKQSLENLFRDYTNENIFNSLQVKNPDAVINFTVIVINFNSSSDLYSNGLNLSLEDEAKDFINYDAVLFMEDLGTFSGFGIRRWPLGVPVFNKDLPYIFQINPKALTPGLFYNELFRRNVPTMLAEYTLGPQSFVTLDSVTYETTPVYNPRTGKAINNTELQFLSNILNGWYDIDFDGIQDCKDTSIQATNENVDADLIPDSLDPDLNKDNSPYFWEPA